MAPRGTRGGRRQGRVGTAYPNRTDLQSSVPVATAPGQVYGERAAQAQAQRAVPVAPPPGSIGPGTGQPGAPPPPPAPGGGPSGPGGGGAAGGPPAAPLPLPGQLPWTGPTERPNEPITAGMASGPGPGPEALTGVGALANAMGGGGTGAFMLASLANRPDAGSQLRDLAALAINHPGA